MANEVNKIIEDRNSKYGGFDNVSNLNQEFRDLVLKRGSKLNAVQEEALLMIMHKISRILCGDPNYEDNWVDIQGYANLAIMYNKND